MTVRVLIADDQPLMRRALADCLRGERDIEVVAEAANGQQAVELATRLGVDVALLDIRMPVLDGLEATRRIVRANGGSRARVVMVTTFDFDEYIVAALRAGASGFLLKDATPEELVQAVRVVARGEALLAPAVTKRLLERYAHYLPLTPLDHDPLAGLTPRELAVLRLVGRGHTNAEVAAELHLAESSVKTHIAHLLSKLRARDRVHLVIHAYEAGLVAPNREAGQDDPGPGVPAV
ncbi:response regulator transcription factor [Terrabacter terrae]|uniref:Response regulator transcription factor n=1 Tax=Terrabacter terrae TaxID=318434 RepID=A0ABP5FCT6_9MICO